MAKRKRSQLVCKEQNRTRSLVGRRKRTNAPTGLDHRLTLTSTLLTSRPNPNYSSHNIVIYPLTHPLTPPFQDEDLIDEALGLKKKRRVDMGNDLDALDIKALLSRGGTERASEVCIVSYSIEPICWSSLVTTTPQILQTEPKFIPNLLLTCSYPLPIAGHTTDSRARSSTRQGPWSHRKKWIVIDVHPRNTTFAAITTGGEPHLTWLYFLAVSTLLYS